MGDGESQALLDQIDVAILTLLSADARRTVTDIAGHVNLSVAPVKRRIDRLERAGVIQGYTVLLDPNTAGTGLQAYVGVKTVTGDDATLLAWLRSLPSVRELVTLSGEDDILLRFQLPEVKELQRVVNEIRNDHRILSTRTSLILSNWIRPADGRSPSGTPTGGDLS